MRKDKAKKYSEKEILEIERLKKLALQKYDLSEIKKRTLEKAKPWIMTVSHVIMLEWCFDWIEVDIKTLKATLVLNIDDWKEWYQERIELD